MPGRLCQYILLLHRGLLRCCAMSLSEGENVASMRKPYRKSDEVFDIELLEDKNPLNIFKEWFSEARGDVKIAEPNAMALATSTLDGKPSVRMVLLKGFDDDGFKFFTHYKSRKGQELEVNPEAYLLFYWPSLERQVRIEGKVEKLSDKESEDYFKTRPRPSQISCAASNQSQPIASKTELENRRKTAETLLANKPVEKPKYWGGYLFKPRSYEFWQGQTTRFHDRIQIKRIDPDDEIDESITKPAGNGWYYERLCP